MNCAIYARVSTEEQAKEGYSIAAQKERLSSFAFSQDWDVLDFYVDEGKSAKDMDRPELQRLLKDIENKKVDVILVYRLDRLTRSVLDLYTLIQHFEKYGTAFKSATEVFDTTTPTGRMFITIVAALAQYERENLAERVKVGMEQKVREGEWRGGIRPYGYDQPNGELVVNPDEARVVKMIYDLYLSGKGFRNIAKHLNSLGYKSKSGTEWSTFPVGYILQNPIYTGVLRWHPGEDDAFEIESNVPAILDKETFEQVQKAIQARKKVAPRQATSNYVFSGYVRCARCGASMIGKKTDQKKKWLYYVCTKRMHGLCNLPFLEEGLLETAFLEAVRKEINAVKVESEQTAAEVAADMEKPEDFALEIASLQKELKSLTSERKEMQKGFFKKLVTADELQDFLQENRTLEQELQARISELQLRSSGEEHQPDDIIRHLSAFEEQWNTQTPQEKKITLSLLVDSIYADAPYHKVPRVSEKQQVIIK